MSVKQDIVLIAAVGEENRVIGSGLELPWHIPEDLKRFKRLTLGKPLLMGRVTYEAIIHQFGRPLGDRRTVVLSSRPSEGVLKGVETYKNVDDAMVALEDEPLIYIGGGATIYEHFLPRATMLELTIVEGSYEGDTFFPQYEHLIGDVFEEVMETRHPGFRFVTYRRVTE